MLQLFKSKRRTLWERACSRMRCVSQHQCRLTGPLREQARSHRFSGCPKIVINPELVWERACSRWGRHIQHLCHLTDRYREQARSHRFFGGPQHHDRPGSRAGASLLAMGPAHLTSMSSDRPLSRAGSLLRGKHYLPALMVTVLIAPSSRSHFFRIAW